MMRVRYAAAAAAAAEAAAAVAAAAAVLRPRLTLAPDCFQSPPLAPQKQRLPSTSPCLPTTSNVTGRFPLHDDGRRRQRRRALAPPPAPRTSTSHLQSTVPQCIIVTLVISGLAGVGIFFQQHPDNLDVFVRSIVPGGSADRCGRITAMVRKRRT